MARTELAPHAAPLAARQGPDLSLRRLAASLAGPALIVGAVLVVLHSFAFGGLVSIQHPDVLAFWLPTYCHLGKSLAAGHIPLWDPYSMAGAPFAADPQSGWMYLPAMALFTALPCDVAIRVMIVLQPALAGLGVYWFARSEGLSRPAATVGGLALSLGLTASRLVLFLPFPSSLAWTAVLLATCSRYVRARSWPSRLGWLLLSALSWGQLAGAHFSQGMVVGTGAAVAYLIGATVRNMRSGEWRIGEAARSLGLLVVALPLVNLAFLLPRLAYLPGTSFLTGALEPSSSVGLAVAWPLRFATAPGFYLGAVTLGLTFAAWWLRRHRAVVTAFGVYGALCYLASLGSVVARVGPVLRHIPLLDFYAHYPNRLGMGLLLIIPVLAAFGVQAWREATSGRERALMVLLGLLVWLLLTVALGAAPIQLAMLAGGAVVGALALLAGARRPGLLWLVPAVLALELTANGLIGQTPRSFGLARAASANPFRADTGWFAPLRRPDVDVVTYLRPGPIALALRGTSGRYLSFAPAIATHRGYLTRQSAMYWGLVANQRGILFSLQDVQGYNPVQLARYWTYLRRVNQGIKLDYTTATLLRATPAVLDLLQVASVVSGSAPPVQGAAEAGAEGPWKLYDLPDPPPRASVVTSVRVVASQKDALNAVTASGFDPSRQVVVEGDAGLRSSSVQGNGAAQYRSLGPERATIEVHSSVPAVVVVRTPYDPNWHATVDGQPVRLVPADYLIQGIPVPAGAHMVVLTYRDPWIGYGLLGSTVIVVALGVAVAAFGRRERRTQVGRKRRTQGPPN